MLSWYERDDGLWEVTYQRNQYSEIQLEFVGTEKECLDFIDKFLEAWG